MNRSIQTLVAVLAASTITTSAMADDQAAPRKVVGQLETIHVQEADMDFLARIDTGARVTSIHATGIEVAEPNPEKKDNVGKTVTFDVTRADGGSRQISGEIVEVAKVRNAQGVEYRYVVELTLVWDGDSKKVQVNLRDRSAMTYKLLIGRNWLRDDYLVDVDVNRPASED